MAAPGRRDRRVPALQRAGRAQALWRRGAAGENPVVELARLLAHRREREVRLDVSARGGAECGAAWRVAKHADQAFRDRCWLVRRDEITRRARTGFGHELDISADGRRDDRQ